MNKWGLLAQRYQNKKPRKILAVDGGGIRGVLSLEILKKIEQDLASKTGAGKNFRLSDYFDFIGGTSTGAIIAAGLSLGWTCDKLLGFYKDHGKKIFDKAFLLTRLKNLYKSEPLAKLLQNEFGENTDLSPEHLKCLLLVVTQNVTTDSPWPISSNPDAKYNDTSRPDCNLRIPLWQLVRASTAAPVYFPPEVVQWDKNDPNKTFVFVDGGMTPYNNPAFLMYRMATFPSYNLNWGRGEKNLLVVSIGTGAAADAGPTPESAHRNLVSNLAGIPGGLMYAAQNDQDVNCRVTGRCTFGAMIDREFWDGIPRYAKPDGVSDEEWNRPENMIPLSDDLGRDFTYVRYNAELSRSGLDELELRDINHEEVQKLDAVDRIDELSRIGKAIAERDVSLDHFGSFV